MCQNKRELVALSGFVKGCWKNLGNLNPAKLVETGRSLFEVTYRRNIAREFLQLCRCMSLSKSSALLLRKMKTAMYGNWTRII